LGIAPGALIFGIGEHGKPYLVAPKPPAAFGFNLSHSGDVVVLGTAADDIGVDVEKLRPVPNAESLARRFFSPAEGELVGAALDPERDRAFLRIWTQKEAWLKATGLGVGMRLAEVETEADPEKPPRLLAISGDRERARRWSFAEAEIPGAVCVVAIEARISEVTAHQIISKDIGRP
jgi:4'-phosphopantetheinyl transferase